MEKEIEKLKTSLALRPDFAIMPLFEALDLEQKTYLSVIDVRDGFRYFGAVGSIDEAALFVRRYNQEGDRVLRYSEFNEAFSP